jgi:hypothetical protein
VAKTSGRKLKVFQAQFGFHDSVVAAPSQAAALRAWGTRQNLFAEGQARLAEDPRVIEAARAHPEAPLRRAVGSNGPFELIPRALPDIADSPRKTAKPAPSQAATPKRPPASRVKLNAAEAALHALEARRVKEETRLQARQTDLDREMAGLQAAYLADRKIVDAAVVAARQAYRKAGGKD